MEPGDLERLVGRARAGDREALDALVRHVGPPVRAVIHRGLSPALRRRVDTDDIFQSAIVDSLAELDRLDWRGEAAFLGWLAAGARRRLVDAARHHRAKRRDVGRDRSLATDAPLDAVRTSPAEGAVRNEVVKAVQEAIASLPPLERRVVELHACQGRPFPETADALGLADRHAARAIFQRALRSLGELVETARESTLEP